MPNIPYGAAGMADYEQSDIFQQVELFASNKPDPFTEEFPVGASTDLPAYSVVGLNASGNLVLADPGAGTPIPAIGITTAPVTTGVGGSASLPIFRSGCFNPDALNWGAWYNTDARKKAAFRGAPTPTTIIIRETVGG